MNIQKIIEIWNKQADEYNQWPDLGEDEKVEFAFRLGASKQNDFISYDVTKEKPTEQPKVTHIIGFEGEPEDKMKRECILVLYDSGVYKLVINSYPSGKEPFTTAIGFTQFGLQIIFATLKEAIENIDNHKL